MTRILADLPDEDIKWLDANSPPSRKSRVLRILREAVKLYLVKNAERQELDRARHLGYLGGSRPISAIRWNISAAMREDRRPLRRHEDPWQTRFFDDQYPDMTLLKRKPQVSAFEQHPDRRY
jgi:hypothetical protein